jgi:hypothetical protein
MIRANRRATIDSAVLLCAGGLWLASCAGPSLQQQVESHLPAEQISDYHVFA